MTIAAEVEGDGLPAITLTGALGQVGLRSLLRRLYSQGLPLVSVICLECGAENGSCSWQQQRGNER